MIATRFLSYGDVAKGEGRGLQSPYSPVRFRSSPPSYADCIALMHSRLRMAGHISVAGEWWNGIHDGLKIHWSQGREGSTPSSPTNELLTKRFSLCLLFRLGTGAVSAVG